MNNTTLYSTEQDYSFCFDAMMALLPFANPKKFYSSHVIDLHRSLFESMKDSGFIDEDEEFRPYVLREELFVGTINNLLEKIPTNSLNKKAYREKLNTLLNSNTNIDGVINYFSNERIRLDKILS